MILLLLGCEHPNLHILYDGQETERITSDGRQLLSPATVTLSLHNPTSVDVRLEELEGMDSIL